jgi:hypothetical protein
VGQCASSVPRPHIAVSLRQLVPYRKLTHSESLYFAEQQAQAFLRLAHVHEPPVPIERLVREMGLATDIRDDPALNDLGQSSCDRITGEWTIRLNLERGTNSRGYVIAHEVKHILDFGFGDTLYRPVDVMTKTERAEHAANYFAACLMVPRPWIERQWRRGNHDLEALAAQFDVKATGMWLRLTALGLLDHEPDQE